MFQNVSLCCWLCCCLDNTDYDIISYGLGHGSYLSYLAEFHNEMFSLRISNCALVQTLMCRYL